MTGGFGSFSGGHLFLELELIFFPPCLDEGKDCPLFFICEHIPEAGHVRWSESAAIGDDVEEERVGVVPRMSGGVVGWCRSDSVFVWDLPIGLAFAVRSMAGGTELSVELLACAGLECCGSVSAVSRTCLRADARARARSCQDGQRGQNDDRPASATGRSHHN